MRICFVGDPRSVHTQRWVRWFEHRHDVALIATADDEALADLTVCTLPSRTTGIGLRLLRSVGLVRNTLARERPDVLHAHFINEAGWFAAASGCHPLVITAWGSDLYRAPSESRLARRLNPWAVRRADCVTCDSADQAAVLRAWGVPYDQVAVIGWGIDRHEFHVGVDGGRLRERLGVPVDAPVVLSPRQWIPNSNIETIVQAHALLSDDVHLVLKRQPRFEHDAARAIDAAVKASPARERIRVLGEISPDELPALFAAADVVVSLCRTDGTPVSLLESMALGLPVVALENASVAEWVREPGGVLLTDLAPQGVANALGRFLSDRRARERAAMHNVAVVADRADRAVEMARMERIYADLMSSGSIPNPARSNNAPTVRY
jgi:glycosyltransferase involved in cell wall biosynthesis